MDFCDKICSISQFLLESRKNLEENNIKYLLEEKKDDLEWAEDGTGCSGYFDERKKVLAVACKKPIFEWFETFVHEYCHFEQWKEQATAWTDSTMCDGSEALDLVMNDFYHGKTLDKDFLWYYLGVAANLEKDCELRVIEKIKKHDLPIDIKKYSKDANSYIVFYYAMFELRAWCGTL